MPYYVYVLYSEKDRSKYVGCTDNLRNRFKQHNSGRAVSTRNKRPLKLIYAEIYLNQQDAFAREKFLKLGWGKNYLRKVLKNYWSKKLGG